MIVHSILEKEVTFCHNDDEKEGDTVLAYRLVHDRVASSENAHVAIVKSSYGCSLPRFRHMRP